MFVNIIRHRSQLYLWIALGLVLVACGLYLSHADLPSPSGSTWQGYVLGTTGAVLIVLLSLLGIRRRSYTSSLGTVKGWVSAHIYFGLALVLIVSWHTGWQFGWNVHTLTYGLMCLVIASGVYGLYAYRAYPRLLSETRAGNSREDMFGELYQLNRASLSSAQQCVPEVGDLVESCIRQTDIGGGVSSQLFGADRSTVQTPEGNVGNADQQVAIDFVSDRVPRSRRETEAVLLQELLTLLCRRQNILRRIRNDIKYQARVRLWLYVHVPFTVALLVALTVHVTTVFLYW